MTRSRLDTRTRQVFHRIHVDQTGDQAILRRLSSLLSTDYFKLEEGWFRGKQCLDAGCGSHAQGTRFLLEQGAAFVRALDLDRSIIKTAETQLKGFEGRYQLDTGSVLDLPYDNETFDFSYCNGVLHHTPDPLRGAAELARVTRPGGVIYILVYGTAGLMQEITNALRAHYARDRGFKRLVDHLSAENLIDLFGWLTASMRRHHDRAGSAVSEAAMRQLFDHDLALTIKDRITAPLYLQVPERDLVACMRTHGCGRIERLTRYPVYSNVRRFLAPLYSDYSHQYARLLYGEGCLQIKAVKLAPPRRRARRAPGTARRS